MKYFDSSILTSWISFWPHKLWFWWRQSWVSPMMWLMSIYIYLEREVIRPMTKVKPRWLKANLPMPYMISVGRNVVTCISTTIHKMTGSLLNYLFWYLMSGISRTNRFETAWFETAEKCFPHNFKSSFKKDKLILYRRIPAGTHSNLTCFITRNR